MQKDWEKRWKFKLLMPDTMLDFRLVSSLRSCFVNLHNTAVKRNAHVRDLRKRGKNKGKLYTKECGLNKNTKYKKTPENIRKKISEYLPCVKRKFSWAYPLVILFTLFSRAIWRRSEIYFSSVFIRAQSSARTKTRACANVWPRC